MKIEVVPTASTTAAEMAQRVSAVGLDVESDNREAVLDRAERLAEHARSTKDIGLLATAFMMLLSAFRR